jgi:hypothetical protein
MLSKHLEAVLNARRGSALGHRPPRRLSRLSANRRTILTKSLQFLGNVLLVKLLLIDGL